MITITKRQKRRTAGGRASVKVAVQIEEVDGKYCLPDHPEVAPTASREEARDAAVDLLDRMLAQEFASMERSERRAEQQQLAKVFAVKVCTEDE